MSVVQTNFLTDPRWDKFVESHPNGWITHLSGWQRVLEKSFPHIEGCHLASMGKRNNRITAVLPLYLVRSWLTGDRLVSSPFATLSDPLISDERQLPELMEKAINLYNDQCASYMEIRALSTTDLLGDSRFGRSDRYVQHSIDLTVDTERIFKSFHRTCVRQRINRAATSEIEIKVGKTIEDLKKFYELYLLTRKRLALPPQPFKFIKSLWEIFAPQDNVELLLAVLNGQLIGGILFIKYRNKVSAEFAATDEAFKNVSPNHLLFWEGMKKYRDAGYRIFDFGRTAKDNQTLMDFKRHWGAKISDLPVFFYPKDRASALTDPKKSKKILLVSKICQKINGKPYQWFGNFCYRHLG